MRRAAAIATVCTAVMAAVLAAPATAESPQPIDGTTGNVFADSSYTLTGGELATLRWSGGGPHDAVATTLGPDGKALFSSALIRSGTTPVNGTQYLGAGSYPFICSVHSGMSSTLLVSGGTPLARPALTARVLSKTKAQLVQSGKVRIATTITGAPTALIEVKLGTKTIASGPAPSGTRTLKLTKKGAAAVAGAKKVRLSVRATVDFGSPVSVVKKLK